MGQAHQRAHGPQKSRVQRTKRARRRWAIERTMSWLSRYRRLSPRYERDPRNCLAFPGLAAALNREAADADSNRAGSGHLCAVQAGTAGRCAADPSTGLRQDERHGDGEVFVGGWQGGGKSVHTSCEVADHPPGQFLVPLRCAFRRQAHLLPGRGVVTEIARGIHVDDPTGQRDLHLPGCRPLRPYVGAHAEVVPAECDRRGERPATGVLPYQLEYCWFHNGSRHRFRIHRLPPPAEPGLQHPRRGLRRTDRLPSRPFPLHGNAVHLVGMQPAPHAAGWLLATFGTWRDVGLQVWPGWPAAAQQSRGSPLEFAATFERSAFARRLAAAGYPWQHLVLTNVAALALSAAAVSAYATALSFLPTCAPYLQPTPVTSLRLPTPHTYAPRWRPSSPSAHHGGVHPADGVRHRHHSQAWECRNRNSASSVAARGRVRRSASAASEARVTARQGPAPPCILESPPLLAQLLPVHRLGLQLPGPHPDQLPSQRLIGLGLGLLVLVERGSHPRAGHAGACECVAGIGASGVLMRLPLWSGPVCAGCRAGGCTATRLPPGVGGGRGRGRAPACRPGFRRPAERRLRGFGGTAPGAPGEPELRLRCTPSLIRTQFGGSPNTR